MGGPVERHRAIAHHEVVAPTPIAYARCAYAQRLMVAS